MESHSIAIHVNGTRIVADVEPRVLLVHFLREQAGLTGTHIGCDTSQCVRLDGATVKSCTVLAVQADGHAVTTIEGLADPARPTPLQQAFHERHALQCGFCTPGMVFAAQALLDYGRHRGPRPGRCDRATLRRRRRHADEIRGRSGSGRQAGATRRSTHRFCGQEVGRPVLREIRRRRWRTPGLKSDVVIQTTNVLL
jgi:aerobic-type carbon monoxide dehydrogenase small subunit (CoxS/CutS family)